MASSSPLLLIFFVFFTLFIGISNAQLRTNYYYESCPHLFPTIRAVVQNAINREARMGASLLRLHFHDCFVNGCDASNLLDDSSSFKSEKSATPNKNSARGFEVIDQIKSAVEKVCPGVVSCADILAITARDSVVILGGPEWEVKLGRRDSLTAYFALANATNTIPAANSSLSGLISSFQNHGLSTRDLVALYGAHTIGSARCTNFRQHIYQDKNIDPSFARSNQAKCPKKNGNGDNNLAPLDAQSPARFDNTYYKTLINKEAILHSDQELYNGGSTDALVRTYAANPHVFISDFSASMIKMGDIKPLIGSQGQVRKNCRRVN
ncbi:peroxidase 4-like [Amaranthus tricolor]|uniref:peroxidase 4-like n=1 Tax=Amaranthus tricolor TaxID=29722 RepID=UPI00258EE4ED|nr:peroxidase 4-like [Amaranthus tricolor]